ncbi:hypothetical protein SVIOM342S_04308 [Streptomyces violaceorubidus]
MDHWEGSVLLIANAINHNDLETGVDEAYADAIARLDVMEADLTRAVAQPPAALPPSELPEYTALWGGPDFQDAVEDIKERIRAGEAFQVVPSQRFGRPARRAPWTCTGCCGPPTRPRTCTCSAWTASTSSARPGRHWSRSRTGAPWCTPSPAPARAAPPRRRTRPSPRNCSPTPRSAPST